MSKLMKSCFCFFLSVSCFSLMAENQGRLMDSQNINPSENVPSTFSNPNNVHNSLNLKGVKNNQDGTTTEIQTIKNRNVKITRDADGIVQFIRIDLPNSPLKSVTAMPTSDPNSWSIASPNEELMGTVRIIGTERIDYTGRLNGKVQKIVISKDSASSSAWRATVNGTSKTLTQEDLGLITIDSARGAVDCVLAIIHLIDPST